MKIGLHASRIRPQASHFAVLFQMCDLHVYWRTSFAKEVRNNSLALCFGFNFLDAEIREKPLNLNRLKPITLTTRKKELYNVEWYYDRG